MRAMRKTTVTIGDQTYEITPLPARVSLALLSRISGVVAAGLGSVRSLADAARAGTSFLSAMLSEVDEALVQRIADEFAKVSFVLDGEKRVPLSACFETQFSGHSDELVQWMRACLEHEYGPLGTWVKRLVPEAPQAQTPSP